MYWKMITGLLNELMNRKTTSVDRGLCVDVAVHQMELEGHIHKNAACTILKFNKFLDFLRRDLLQSAHGQFSPEACGGSVQRGELSKRRKNRTE
jgi:hypothetical protein